MTKQDNATLTAAEAAQQVQLLARRMALMYHHIGEVLTEQLGKDRAVELMRESIWRYGVECGRMVRDGVEEMGLPLTSANFTKVPDLPEVGWDRELCVVDGEARPTVHHCPLAEVWLSKGSAEMGRIYCLVDQAKFAGYNPALECLHLANVLDGDESCVLAIRERPAIRVRAYRSGPEAGGAGDSTDANSGGGGRYQEYVVPTADRLSVMTLMAKIRELDPTFACRTSMCYHGTCGSCWVRVNGKNVKGCLRMVAPGESVTLEPASGYAVLRDLVVDFARPLGSDEVDREVE